MPVDVVTQIEIARPRAEVAAFAGEPDHAPRWYVNIERVVWKRRTPELLGSQMEFVAHFLGKQLVYTYEIVEYVPAERLVMRTAEGPFPMETTYEWSDTDAGTRMTLRNRGEPRGFGRVFAPLMARMMARANRKDLEALRRLLESPPD